MKAQGKLDSPFPISPGETMQEYAVRLANTEEILLFHGTDEATANQILESGTDVNGKTWEESQSGCIYFSLDDGSALMWAKLRTKHIRKEKGFWKHRHLRPAVLVFRSKPIQERGLIFEPDGSMLKLKEDCPWVMLSGNPRLGRAELKRVTFF